MEKISNSYDDFLATVNRNKSQEFPCIPTSLPKLNNEIAGITQGTYYLITASSKVGKSQITDQLFLYDVVEFLNSVESNIKVKIFYNSMEMSRQAKMAQATSRYIFKKYGKVFDIRTILGLKKYDNPKLYDAIVEARVYWEQIEAITEFEFSSINPTGIYKKVESYARSNGTIFNKKKTIKVLNDFGEYEDKEIEVFDKYVPNNPNEYVIILKDSLNLLDRERQKIAEKQYILMDLKRTIEKMSRDDIIFRDNYNYIPVNIQQQSAATENPNFYKGEKVISSLEPSISSLGETNLTGRDASIILGLFSPYLHDLQDYRKYKPSMKDTYRDLSILRDRNGNSNLHIPLYFNGACNYFKEIPTEVQQITQTNMYGNT